MASFKDLQTAARMRDIVERMVVSIINKERPGERIGLVYKADLGNQFAWIQFPGETEDNLVKVRVSKNLYPTKTVETHGSDDADIVRVSGRPGAYYISDMIRGVGAVGIPVGTIMPYAGPTAPASYFLCDGSELFQADEPDLFAVIGTLYGAGSGSDTFLLPDMTGRLPYGRLPGAVDANLSTLGNGLGSDTANKELRMDHQHTHSIPGAAAGNTWLTPNTGSNTSPRSGAFDNHDHGGSTGTKALGDTTTKFHPILVVNFIIKA